MDFYSDKYQKMCVSDSDNIIIDIIVKNNKIYKVINQLINIDSTKEYNALFNELINDKEYVLKSSIGKTILLEHSHGEKYVVINIVKDYNGQPYYHVELINPVIIDVI